MMSAMPASTRRLVGAPVRARRHSVVEVAAVVKMTYCGYRALTLLKFDSRILFNTVQLSTCDIEGLPDRPRQRARFAAPETLEERRRLIVRAALDLLDEEGFDAMSLRHLARHLGMHAPGLYWYFESKQELTDLMAKAILEDGLSSVRSARTGTKAGRNGSSSSP